MVRSAKSIAMIGAGPASLYATEVLADAGHHVTILNRDIKPGGLAEFGIYPTKYKMKGGLRKYFHRILSHERVNYYGNITVGEQADLTLDELRELGFDALIVAVGAQGTKWLGLEGEEAESVFHAKDLVYHYNQLPPFSETEFPIGENVAVIGLGNVCLDVVHWMVCEKGVKSVTAVARRGPEERKFTKKEFKLVSGALDVNALREEIDSVAPTMKKVGQDPEQAYKELIRYIDEPLEKESTTSFRMRFLRTPKRIEVDESGQVLGLVCEKTELVPGRGDRIGLERLGETETIECDTVIFAIGDSIEPSLGLPLSPEWSGEFATVKEPWEEDPEAPRYMVYDPNRGEPLWDTFVIGWARKASDGLVGKARSDAVQGCKEIMAFLEGQFRVAPLGQWTPEQVHKKLKEILRERELVAIDYDQVRRLLELEALEAERLGLVEYKFPSRREILSLLQSSKES